MPRLWRFYICMFHLLFSRFVFYMATLTQETRAGGETSGVFPRGSVVWDNSKTVLCDESLPHHNHANHQLQTARQ